MKPPRAPSGTRKPPKYPIHADFRMLNFRPRLNKLTLALMKTTMKPLIFREKSDGKIKVSRLSLLADNGETLFALLYAPAGIGPDAPCLVYFHGGGFVMRAAPHHFKLAREYALRADCKVLFADYRLAPKHPFPAAVNDCWMTYFYAVSHASGLGIDPNRIAVGGDSAGGMLAAAVCLMAKDRKKKMPCAQMLVYPATGDNRETGSMLRYTDVPMCSSKDVVKYAKLYLRGQSAEKREYVSPVDAPSFAGLAPAYVETAEFDCLRDGGILYAERLKAAGVSARVFNTEGTVHGFDVISQSPITRACIDSRAAFLKEAFSRNGPDKPHEST